MQEKNELRNRQMAITEDFKSRAQKAEKILGEIEECEKTISALNESLSALLGIGVNVKTAVVVANVQQAKAAKVKSANVKAVKVAKAAKTAKVKPVVKKDEAPTLRDSVRDFMLKEGKPMKIAEIVQGMQKAGHVFQAKRPVAAMSLLMYNNAKVFKRVKPGTFKAV